MTLLISDFFAISAVETVLQLRAASLFSSLVPHARAQDPTCNVEAEKNKHGRTAMLGACQLQNWTCRKLRAASLEVDTLSDLAPPCWLRSRKFSNKLCHAENGNTASAEQVLKDVLWQHGVPVDSVQQRVQHAIKVTCLRALQSDIDSTSEPRDLWARLKARADRQFQVCHS